MRRRPFYGQERFLGRLINTKLDSLFVITFFIRLWYDDKKRMMMTVLSMCTKQAHTNIYRKTVTVSYTERDAAVIIMILVLYWKAQSSLPSLRKKCIFSKGKNTVSNKYSLEV